ncbi:hypothetical protein GCM10010435_69980 [Winogradskya consettensis]|uniref:Uncharacterized protein n=1 Tax=Winogradskya consettensis TaxID=113560 RepID=A0A919SQ31_9ACTN|nr:hypothetical protein Aco04nite_46120 [Actinoplanes consettensis]
MSPMTPSSVHAALRSTLRRLDSWTLSTLNAPNLARTTRNR